MLKRLCAVLAATLLAIAGYAAASGLREGHPTQYTVQAGDTLWGIASRFLSQPWLWPEIWQANPQIDNPHRLFPGDVISLAYLDGRPVITTQAAGPRREPAITTLPLGGIEAFLHHHEVVESFDTLPYVVALEGERTRGAEGQIAYVRGLEGARIGDTVAIVRPSHRFTLPSEQRRLNTIAGSLDHRGDVQYTDWRSVWRGQFGDGGEVLGYELIRQSLARITQVQGEIALALLVDGTAEVRAGDRVQPLAPRDFDQQFQPRPPAAIPEHASVLAVADASLAAGPNSVVALAVGRRDGVENGTLFSIWRPGSMVPDEVRNRNPIAARGDRVQLPDEYAGQVMVFRSFDRVSYAQVLEGIRPVEVGHRLKHPEAVQ